MAMALADTPVDFGLLAGAGAPIRNYKAGEVIFREGDPALEMFVIKTGTVEIRLGNRLLDTLGDLSIFGEMALIDHGPRSASAVAVTDADIVPVAERQFLLMVSRTPYFALNVMRVLVQRLRTSNSVIYYPASGAICDARKRATSASSLAMFSNRRLLVSSRK